MKKVFLCVTTNLSYDQRMKRICTSLQVAGYAVTLIGRHTQGSPLLDGAPYHQVRLTCWFQKGKLMYLEYNLRLLIFLLLRKPDLITAIDLDTIVPCYLVSRIKGIPRVYDAHEWFSEMKEVVTRPPIQKVWRAIERTFVPRFPLGYTVSQSIADAFRDRYGVNYELIMNTPPLNPHKPARSGGPKFFLYQGAVNEGRGFEWLIPAMKNVHAPLWICGEGNFSEQCQQLIREHGLEGKVIMKGNILPSDLVSITAAAYAGINLVEPNGLNQIYSLTNKYFDYIHAGIPQLTMNFPEYARLNASFPTSILINSLDPDLIARELNNLLENEVLYTTLVNNCGPAAETWNWNNEEVRLARFYMDIFQ